MVVSRRRRAQAASGRAGLLVVLALVLAQCSGIDIGTCDHVPEVSTGACRVGLSADWQYSEQWRQYYEP
jgi:hypothetical protein